MVGEPRVHFGRCFGSRCVLEIDADAVYCVFFERFGNNHCRWDQASSTNRQAFTDGRVYLPEGAGWNEPPILKSCSARHRIACVDILGDCLFHKADRGVNIDLAIVNRVDARHA